MNLQGLNCLTKNLLEFNRQWRKESRESQAWCEFSCFCFHVGKEMLQKEEWGNSAILSLPDAISVPQSKAPDRHQKLSYKLLTLLRRSVSVGRHWSQTEMQRMTRCRWLFETTGHPKAWIRGQVGLAVAIEIARGTLRKYSPTTLIILATDSEWATGSLFSSFEYFHNQFEPSTNLQNQANGDRTVDQPTALRR